MPVRIAVVGSGAWGIAVARLLAQKPDHRVGLWSWRPELTQELRATRENKRVLPGIHIPEAVELESELHKCIANCDLYVSAVPTVYLRSTLMKERPQLPVTTPVLSLSKGVEIQTFQRPTEILHELLGSQRLAVLSGPSHAEEVARGMPASVVAASSDHQLADWVQGLFNTDRFRVYTNQDVIGVELAAALKNVIAIAAGIGDGLQLGDNAKSALVTRGLVEMARFGVAHGADVATYSGLAGMGDLITTCFSRHGRNRMVGERLAKGEKLKDILQSTEMVAEGVYTAKSVYEQSKQMGIELPIVNEVYAVLYEDKSPQAAVEALMSRTPMPERRK
jgi:glycerol-3-phosphate dehydrogenase (NAD(P)+)